VRWRWLRAFADGHGTWNPHPVLVAVDSSGDTLSIMLSFDAPFSSTKRGPNHGSGIRLPAHEMTPEPLSARLANWVAALPS
jgi:hypothetical protein